MPPRATRHGLLPFLAALALTTSAASARPLEELPTNVVLRPLVLEQEVFERAITSTIVYFADRTGYSTKGPHLGNIASTLWLAAGATDWLQVALVGTVSIHRPDGRVVRPGLEVAALPHPYVAPRVRLYVPDCWDEDAWNWSAGVRGRYPVLPAVLDVGLDLDLEHYRSEIELSLEGSPVVTSRTLQALAFARWVFAPRFHVGVTAGASKTWLTHADDRDPQDPPWVPRYGLEVGFASLKHVDVVLGWGAPPVVMRTWDWAQFVSLKIGGRI